MTAKAASFIVDALNISHGSIATVQPKDVTPGMDTLVVPQYREYCAHIFLSESLRCPCIRIPIPESAPAVMLYARLQGRAKYLRASHENLDSASSSKMGASLRPADTLGS